MSVLRGTRAEAMPLLGFFERRIQRSEMGTAFTSKNLPTLETALYGVLGELYLDRRNRVISRNVPLLPLCATGRFTDKSLVVPNADYHLESHSSTQLSFNHTYIHLV